MIEILILHDNAHVSCVCGITHICLVSSKC